MVNKAVSIVTYLAFSFDTFCKWFTPVKVQQRFAKRYNYLGSIIGPPGHHVDGKPRVERHVTSSLAIKTQAPTNSELVGSHGSDEYHKQQYL